MLRTAPALALVGVAVMLLGAGLWFYLYVLPEPPPPAIPAPPLKPLPLAPDLPKTGQGPEKKESLQDVRELLGQRLPPAELYEHAQRYLAHREPGPAFALLRTAARGGSGAAAFNIGQMYDPIDFDKRLSAMPKPNPQKAIEWYQQAVKAGVGSAQEAIDQLLELLRGQAASGDADARQILERLKKQ